MKILSIETSGSICGVALTEDDKLIKEELIDDGNTHSVKLMPLIDKLLSETNTKVSDIDLFACDIGPGSFTGIRIGVSTVKAFMDVTNKKAVGITSLEMLAYNIDTADIVCSLIDAKNENVYYGFFEKKNGTYKNINELGFDNINNVLDIAKQQNKKIIFIGNGSTIYKDMIESKLNNAEVILDEKINKLNAKNIAFAAYKKQDEAVDSNNLSPVYLRKSNAELQRK